MYLFNCYSLPLQTDDDIVWDTIKPHVYAAIMDFFASGLPVISEELTQSQDTGKKL